MKAFLSQLSHEEIRVDITSTADTYKKEIATGYHITFELVTKRFRFEGRCELREYPLTEQQIQQKLLTGLEEDLLEASAEGITGIL